MGMNRHEVSSAFFPFRVSCHLFVNMPVTLGNIYCPQFKTGLTSANVTAVCTSEVLLSSGIFQYDSFSCETKLENMALGMANPPLSPLPWQNKPWQKASTCFFFWFPCHALKHASGSGTLLNFLPPVRTADTIIHRQAQVMLKSHSLKT